jgi:Ankyrin repeats (many copies)
MTSKESAQDQELLERYKRASDTASAVPSEAVRAAILAEARRVAEQRAKEVPEGTFDVTRPAANDARWKTTAFGTAGAALVAALLFAPRLWENAPPPRSASNTTVVALADKAIPSADKDAPSEAGAAQPPKLESLRAARNSSESLQEIVVTQATRESSKAAGAAAGKLSAPTAPPTASQAAPAAPPPAFANAHAAGVPTAPPASSLDAARDARARSAPQTAALQFAAASGDTAQTTALLDQGAALDVRDDLGRTPLMLAVMQRKPEVVRLLLDRGADPTIADSTGRTPLQQAKQKNFREIAALLERAGAR